jgi:Holliday junction resolvase-like predicted endonuclease
MSNADRRLAARRKAERRGRRSETLAAVLLMLKFYRILGRRVRTHAGEIDLVARSPAGVICFARRLPSRWVRGSRPASNARRNFIWRSGRGCGPKACASTR